MTSFFPRRASSGLLVAVIAATTAACSDLAPNIAQPNLTRVSTSVSSAGSQYSVRSNADKYSDAGAKPWRGKSSKGQEVWSRAPIGQDGVVTLKVASI